MVAPPWPDYYYTSSTALVERAWHLLTVLLRLGRPAPAAELASRCVLEVGADFVEILCSIPGSPLMLTDDGFVTPSDVSTAAFLQFLSTGIAPLVPRFPFTVAAQVRACGEVFMMYTRKRKLQLLEDDRVETPTAKRRLLLPDGGDLKEFGGNKEHFNQLCVVQSSRKATAKALQINHTLPGIPINGAFSVGSFLYENLSKVNNHKPSLPVQIGSTKTASAKMLFNKIQPLPLFKITSDFQINKKNFDDIRGNAYLHNVSISNGTVCHQRDIGVVMQNYVKKKPAKFEDETDSLIVRCSQSTAEFPPTIKLDLNDLKDLGGQINYDDQNFNCQTLGKLHEATTTKGIFCQSEAGTSPSQKNPEGFLPPEQTDKVLKPFVACQSAGHQIVHNNGRKSMKSYAVGTSNLCGEFCHSTSPMYYQRDRTSIKDNQESRVLNCFVKKQKMKKVSNTNIVAKYKDEDPVPKTPKSHLDSKLQPKLESFIIEEEEGSGGYGTVYRARRKKDGKIFAVKCPHANAHLQHVHNEMRMLARFGGRNFVIKYEGSFKSGNSDCFVLEHVEHDRPEVLKKDITIFELQWYGYCMFRALVSLHKQGIVHRDVKPGNFLFSRQHNKGYLIDFNLANDLHQKFFKNSKTEIGCNIKLDPVLHNLKSSSPKQPKRVTKDGILVNGTDEVDDLKSHPSRSSRKKTERNPVAKIDNKNRCCNQAADISGVTSARDPTSTKTPVDKLKQPIPCKGRKELINFLHEAMQTPDHKGSIALAQRKRVAAPLGKVERKLVTVTPMPLHFDGNAVAGAGMLDSKKNGKHKREGPCVGTKGFRAPEVLLKSIHQGCKVDVWSAGVTLLYLMIGKTPFGGDPEQNIKDIAKLRGSEDLWEVAKLHNTEPFFPQELYDARSLRSLELKEWCILNTRRPEFIEAIPDSLFDLVNKCLTINPRCRIAADEALGHEFFAPCHESLRRQRMLRMEAAQP